MLRQAIVGLVVIVSLPGTGPRLFAASPPIGDSDATIRSASRVIREIRTTPGKQIPADILARAQAVVIVPDAVKLGVIGGVRSGHGVALIRQEDGTWTYPQMLTLAGGSLGLQLGVEDIDMVLVFTTRRAAAGLASGKFTLGADASASAGPVGRDSSALTDGRSLSEVLSYSRSRGLFLGASIDGARLHIDVTAVRAYYGAAPPQPPVLKPEPAATLHAQWLAAVSGAPDPLPQGPRYDPPATAKSKPYKRLMTPFGTGPTGGAGT